MAVAFFFILESKRQVLCSCSSLAVQYVPLSTMNGWYLFVVYSVVAILWNFEKVLKSISDQYVVFKICVFVSY